MKALIRTAILVAGIWVATLYIPELMPYRTIALMLAVAYGLFGLIARTLLVGLLIVAAAAAYFLNLF